MERSIRYSIALLLLLSPTLVFGQVASQPHSVFGNGGALSTGGSFKLQTTVGQSIAGITSNGSNINSIGFWYVQPNLAPTATAQTVNPLEDVDITITLAGTDPEGATLSKIISTLPSNGALYQTSDGTNRGAQINAVPTTVTDSQMRVIYVSASNGNGNNHGNFGFKVNDGIQDSPEATVTVNVTEVNDEPSFDAIADPAGIPQDSGQQTIGIAGINGGGGELQPLSFSGSSSNTGLIPNPSFTYESPNSTGSLSYTPVAGVNGTAVITVTLTDAGGTANGGDDSFQRTFTVTVIAPDPNVQPTLDAISDPAAILEDAGEQTVNLSNVTAGAGDNQVITVTASSDNTGLIPNPTVNYTSPNNSGTLTYTPVGNTNGSATITVTVKDNGGTANGGSDTITRTFTVQVNFVNDAPTLAAIPDPAEINQDEGEQTVNLTGIGTGASEAQTVTITATSSNTGLIPNPTVNYTSPSATGTLTYTPVAGASGTATITVTASDNGGTDNGGVNTVSQTFTVTVNAVAANAEPTLTAIPDPAAILQDAGQQTINLAGIAAGSGETQVLTVTATSSNTALIPNPTVNYTSPEATGTLTYTPVAGASGNAVITVTVTDDGGTANGGDDTVTQTFTVTVNAVAANAEPTLTAIPDPAAILQDAGQQTINLAGIAAGSGETQVLTVTATSSNTALIPNPTVNYTSPEATGTLTYTPVAGASGNAVITVTVTDDGGTANGGVNTVSQTFTIAVNPLVPNVAPTLTAISDPAAILEDAGAQTIPFTGVGAGAAETQSLTVTVVSSNEGLIPTPTISYQTPNDTGTISYTPTANISGQSTITITVTDDGGTANGGTNTTSQSFTV